MFIPIVVCALVVLVGQLMTKKFKKVQKFEVEIKQRSTVQLEVKQKNSV